MADERRFSAAKPLVYLALCSYLAVVVYPMIWLLYTSLKTDREIFLSPFSLPEFDNLQWINFINRAVTRRERNVGEDDFD